MWVAGLQPTPPGRALGSSAPRSPELSPDPKKAGPPGRGQGAQRWEEGGRGKQMRIWVENMQEEGIDAWPGRQMVGVAGAPLHLRARANTHTHTHTRASQVGSPLPRVVLKAAREDEDGKETGPSSIWEPSSPRKK